MASSVQYFGRWRVLKYGISGVYVVYVNKEKNWYHAAIICTYALSTAILVHRTIICTHLHLFGKHKPPQRPYNGHITASWWVRKCRRFATNITAPLQPRRSRSRAAARSDAHRPYNPMGTARASESTRSPSSGPSRASAGTVPTSHFRCFLQKTRRKRDPAV